MLPQFLIDGLLLSGLYVLVALGLALCFGTISVLNFAHGEAIMLGAYGSFWLQSGWGLDPLISLLPLMVVGFVAGSLLFVAASGYVLNAPHMNQILLTFGLALILQNGALMAWTGDIRSATPPWIYISLDLGPAFIPLGRLIAFGVAAALAALLLLWLHRTELGRASRAIAQNAMAATLFGIDVRRVYAITFGISVALAVAAGVIFSWIGSVTPFMGLSLVLKALAVMILGGIGSMTGTILGGIVLGFAETAVAYFVPDGSGWAEGVAFVLLFAILVLRPNGLLGRAGA